MKYEEAKDWLEGNRSMCNIIPQDPLETWQVRIAQADTAMMEQAYWVVRAYEEGASRNWIRNMMRPMLIHRP